MGIEPTSSAWEAEVMAIIRRPQNEQFYRGSGGNGKREVLGGGSETGTARCWRGGVADSASFGFGRERKSSDFLLHAKLLVVKFSLLENNLRCVLYGDFAR